MISNPQNFVICPNLIIMEKNRFLLLKRADWAPLFPGHWHCVTGKIEENETPKQTIIREAFEEVGLHVNPTLELVVSVTARNFQNPELIWRDLSLFFLVKDPESSPINNEPRLHDAMEWFDVNNLPHPMIPIVKFGVEQYLEGQSYAEFNDL